MGAYLRQLWQQRDKLAIEKRWLQWNDLLLHKGAQSLDKRLDPGRNLKVHR
jgi:hypothetical protein